jgi:hypothetical protein
MRAKDVAFLLGWVLVGCGDTSGSDGKDSQDEDTNADTGEEEVRYYEGGWPIGACEDDIEATGNEEGEVAEDFALSDQYGEVVRLHSFCDRVVYLVGAAFW